MKLFVIPPNRLESAGWVTPNASAAFFIEEKIDTLRTPHSALRTHFGTSLDQGPLSTNRDALFNPSKVDELPTEPYVHLSMHTALTLHTYTEWRR